MGIVGRRRSVGIAVALLLAALGGLTACVGSSKDAVGQSCTSPGISAQEVRAGLIFPDSGPLSAPFVGFRGGVDARFGEANAAGGVNGRRLVYDWEDDAGDLDKNSGAARTLIQRRDDFGLMEISPVSAGSAPWLHAQGVPVTGTANDASWARYDNMFTYSYLPGGDAGVDTWGRFARQRHGTRAMIVYISLSDQSLRLADIYARSMQAVGIQVASKVQLDPGTSDPAPIADQFKREGDNILIGIVTDSDFAGVTRAIHANGGDLRAAISPNGYGSTAAGGLRWPPGSFVYLDYRPFESGGPAHTRFLTALDRYAPQIQPQSRAVALSGWLVADTFIRGLEAAGPCPSRSAFIENLRKVKGYNADGLLVNTVDFAQDFGRTNKCLSFVQLNATGTAWSVVDPLPLCGEFVPGS